VEQEHAARAAAEAARARAVLLAEASALLGESLDYEPVLARLADLVARTIADWCLVDLVEEGRLRRAAQAHRDPAKQPALDGQAEAFPSAWDSPHPATRVLESGFAVPLVARGRVLGAITVGAGQSSRRLGHADLELCQELARRAAIAVDNAHLYRQTQEAVRLRDEFLVVASHELNTPTAALTLSLDMLRERLRRAPPDRTLHQVTEVAARQGARLTRLIGELLDATTLEQAGPTLEPATVELGAVVRGVLGRLAPELERAGCSVSVDAPEPVVGVWDEARLGQILASLLSNAAKFGAGKPIEVRVGRKGDRAWLSVTDHGIGVDRSQHARIFERFVRGVSAGNFGGLGLGLYISRKVAESHGGSLRVESDEGGGATFVLELPIAGPGSAGRPASG
jgi:signal transduction histidine kinase